MAQQKKEENPNTRPHIERPEMPRLNTAQREFVFKHLGRMIELEEPYKIADILPWPDTDLPMRTDYRVDGVPILYPTPGVPETETRMYTDDGHTVRLTHDLMRSTFYLLSGRQEHDIRERDKWGRFPYALSIQAELGIEHMPVADYYMDWMIEAIERQCELSGIKYRKEKPMRNGATIHLSHDVDLVHYFTFRKTLYRFAQAMGLRPLGGVRRLTMWRDAFWSLLNIMHLRHDPDPYWSFDEIQDEEAFIGYHSDWFFLPLDDDQAFPPDYDFRTDEDIQRLMKQLFKRKHTVNLHAPIECRTTMDYRDAYADIHEVFPQARPRSRQHFLAIDPDTTYRWMDVAGIEADYSYGFSEHEGFRNSTCRSFHPYDHGHDKTLRIICLPLALMDVTCLCHRGMTYDEIFLAVGEMLDEVRRHEGIFSLLWHNSTFDESLHPGIHKFYHDLHLMFAQYQMASFA